MATNTEQLFQSKHLAAEMEEVFDGSILSNKEQNLTETEKAVARNNIGAVPFGSILKILGHVDTAAELESIISPKVGDAYSVGIQTPFNLWIYDGLRMAWIDYGQIRATDIASRYVENYSITANAWTLDESVFAEYRYKARIVFDGATSDDFPIVAFETSEAGTGNFAQICFAWNGYLEVFAKNIPNGAINIPVATIIVNGGNGKGITNAGISIADNSIKSEKIADKAVTYEKIDPVALCSKTMSYNGGWTIADTNHIGRTITTVPNTGSFNLKFTLQNESRLHDNTEIAIFRGNIEEETMTIEFEPYVSFTIQGHDTIAGGGKVNIMEKNSLVAIKKINGTWFVAGNVEVIEE